MSQTSLRYCAGMRRAVYSLTIVIPGNGGHCHKVVCSSQTNCATLRTLTFVSVLWSVIQLKELQCLPSALILSTLMFTEPAVMKQCVAL